MSSATTPPSPPSRPSLLDYLFVLAGAALSLYLMQQSPLAIEVSDSVPPAQRALVVFLGGPLRLTEGIILLWPLFFAGQRLRWRREPLTGGEWLWVLSWVGIAVLTGLGFWQNAGTLPGFLSEHAGKPRILWYMVFVPAIAVLGGVLAVGGLLRRAAQPWTHPFGLALVLWPVLPLAGIFMYGSLK
jgi:hypothetical protein